MPGLEGESTNKFQKLLKPLTKTPWRSFKSALSRTFTRKGNNTPSFEIPPIRHDIGTVYEHDLGVETGLPIPTNRGGLKNYIDNLDAQIELLIKLKGELDKKDITRLEKKELQRLASQQIDNIRKLKSLIRQKKVKNTAHAMALEVKGTIMSPNGKSRLNNIEKQQENTSISLVKEIDEGMKNIEVQLDKSESALNRAFGINNPENGMPPPLGKPIELPTGPLNNPRSLGTQLTLRNQGRFKKGGKKRNTRRRR